MNILIVKLSAIGDVIHTLPALNAIRAHFPFAKITWLAEKPASGILEGHPALDRIIISERKKWLKMLKNFEIAKAFREIKIFISKLRDTKYDMVFDFQALMKSGILIAMVKGEKKIGFGKGMEHDEHSFIFLNHRVKAVDMNIHAIDRYLMMIKACGIEHKNIEYNISISEKDRKAAQQLLDDANIYSDDFIAVNPVAKWDTKLWPQENFSALADRLILEDKINIVFTGSNEDVPAVESIIAKMHSKQPVNLAGKTSLKTLAALYEKAKILVTTDTGPMHLGAALNIPVISIFGPTAPYRTGPYGQQYLVCKTDIDCSPCFKRQCIYGHLGCMKKISPEYVLEKIRELCFE